MRQSLQSTDQNASPDSLIIAKNKTENNSVRKLDPRVFRRLLPYLRPYRAKIALGVTLLLISTPLGSAHPLIWKYIVDVVITKHRPENLLGALLAMFVI